MNLRFVTCARCGHKWATKIKPRRCPGCTSAYWRKPSSRGEQAPEEIQRHPTLTNREFAAVLTAARLDCLNITGKPVYCKPVQEWEIECSRGELSPEELERYQHAKEVLETYDRADRERREKQPQCSPTAPVLCKAAAATLLSPGPDPDSELEIRRKARDRAAQELLEKTGIIS